VAPERVGRVVALLAVAAGITVANLYYAQPLLDALAGDFGVGRDAVSLVVTLGQLGYAAGIVALVPLGDVVDDRKLTLRVLAVAVAAAAACALAPSFVVFLTAALVLGSTAVVAQIVLPIAARVVPAERRGQLVGRVTGGLLLGILLARAFAGLVAAASSWRVVFGFSAVAMAVLAVVLARSLPRRGPTGALHYRSLLGSVAVLVREEPVLRRRALYQAAMFGAFSLFWTSASFQLAGLGVGQAGIGVFALVGAAGALAAPLAGRLGDRGLGRPATGGHPAARRRRGRHRRVRSPVGPRAGGRRRGARPRGAGQPGPRPAGRVCPPAGGAVPDERRLHRQLLPRRCGRVRGVRVRLHPRRLARGDGGGGRPAAARPAALGR